MSTWFEIQAKGDDAAEVYIYDEIGSSPWNENGVEAKPFIDALNKVKAKNIALRINSPGGDVFAGQAIFNAIKRHPANVTTYVDGLAASIASVIAMAGDKVVMASNSMLMIHNAWGLSMGNANDMRAMADTLGKIDGTLIDIYAEKTEQDPVTIAAAMDAETWFTADEALEWGFADEVGEELKVAAHFDLSKFKNAPTATDASVAVEEPTQASVEVEEPGSPAESPTSSDDVKAPPPPVRPLL